MRLPWPSRSTSENGGRADMLGPPIQVRFVPLTDIGVRTARTEAPLGELENRVASS